MPAAKTESAEAVRRAFIASVISHVPMFWRACTVRARKASALRRIGVVAVAVPLADSAVPSVDEALRTGCGKTSRPRSFAWRWVRWIEEARCSPSGFTAHPPSRRANCWLRPLVISLLHVAGRPRVSADRLNSVARARTECNTGGFPISGGRRNDVEERRTGAGSAKDSELEEPDACGVGGDLEAGPCRLDQGEAVRIALAGHAEKTMRFEIGAGQLTNLAGGHKERAADIASLPLHPVGLGRVENDVAIADLHARIRVAFQQVRAWRLQIPQIGVESNMAVFMGECRTQAVLPVVIPSQGSQDPHTRFPAGLEMREPLDIAAIAGQVCELVEGLGVALDEHRQVIGRNGILRGAMPFLEEAGDDVLAL